MSNKNDDLTRRLYGAIMSADRVADMTRRNIEKIYSALDQCKSNERIAIDQINNQEQCTASGTVVSELYKQSSDLEEQWWKLSSERTFLTGCAKGDWTRFYCSFFGNVFKKRVGTCDALMRNIENQKSQIQIAIQKFEKHAHIKAADIERQAQIKIAEVEKQTQNKVEELQQTIRNMQSQFVNNWASARQSLRDHCQEIERRQPKQDKFKRELLQIAGEIPTEIVFGYWKLRLKDEVRDVVRFEQWGETVPHLVDFPFAKPLYGEFENDWDKRRVHALLLRLLFTLPVGTVELTVIDPVKLGQSVEEFNQLLNIEKLVPLERWLTTSEEIEKALFEMYDYSKELLQKRLQDKDRLGYKEDNRDTPWLYKVLLIFGFPEQFSDRSVLHLKRILENGLASGILPIVLKDTSKIQSKIEKRRISAETEEMLEILQDGQNIRRFKFPSHLNLSALDGAFSDYPLPKNLSECLDWIAEAYGAYVASKNISKTIRDMWLPEPFGESSMDGISTLIGWNDKGQEVTFTLGARQNSEHHALLAGRGGSGKSNVLHVLIHGLLRRYSAEELNLYLLDYKEGVEMNAYTKLDVPIPQIKLVATESDREYGVTVLEHLCGELKKRSELFKREGTSGLYDYRDKTGEKLSRILLIIDEFQVLIESDDSITKRAIECFATLFKQGRSAGVHILLATQTLKGLYSSGVSGSFGPLFTQIGCRIALSCGEEDSQLILSNSNQAAVKLRGKGDGILNNSNGQKSGNIFFNIPFADPINREEHLVEIAESARQKGNVTETKVFNGTHLPEFSPEGFRETNKTKMTVMRFGVELNFAANPFEFQWERKVGNNLCIAGLDDPIRQGMLRALLECAKQNQMFDNIVYFNTDPYKTWDIPNIDGLVLQDSTWECNLSTWTSEYIKAKRTLLIIDAIDDPNARGFHPKPTFGIKKDTSETPAESLKRLLEEGPRHGSFVAAFVDNWNTFSTACKDYLNQNLFELRIGFRLNEEDAGNLVFGNMGGKRIKGLDDGHKAIFVNRQRNTQILFRPFVVPSEK